MNPTTPPPAPEATSPRSPVSTNHFDEPILSQEDFQLLWSSREFKSPPPFLTDIDEPLHPRWKSLENLADGAYLFRTAADHVWLKDYKLLRKFVHQHIIDDWFFYGSFYVFPISIQIGPGNGSYRKVIENETRYLEFLKSEESMISFNTSNAEIIAIGNVLKVNIHVLTYNIQGRVGELTERTRWNKFEFNPAMTNCNVFSDRSGKEPSKILNEEEVHYTKLVWMPETTNGNECSSADDTLNNDTIPTSFADHMNESSSSQGSLTS